MQSVKYQIDAPYHTDDAGVAEIVRPEPMVSDRIGVRTELADTFRSLGRGMHAKAAYRQAREFYRASGHEWTRTLK